MTEFKITVEAPELSAAINALATAISGVTAATETTPVKKTRSSKAQTAQNATPAPIPEQPAPVQQTPVQQTQMPTVNPVPMGVPVQQMPVQQPQMPTANPVPMGMPVQQPPQMPVQQPQAVPGVRTYTTEDIARAGSVLLSEGKQADLNGLLQQFGVASINQLRPEQLVPFADGLRAMGAPI